MKKTTVLAGILAFTIISGLMGCGPASDTTTTSGLVTNPAQHTTTSTPLPTRPGPATTTSTVTTTTTTTDAALSIPSGSLALFATLSGGTQSDFIRVEGGTVNWDTTHYKFLRYVPEAQLLDEFGWTSSKSYSKSYIYGMTTGDRVYMVKCFTDSGRKDVTRLDPRTGETIGAFAPFTTSDMYGGFTISGDRILYRTKVNKDVLGNRTSGGNVMAVEPGSTGAVEVLDYYDNNNLGGYYAIGDDLVTIDVTWENDIWYYDIYRADPATLAVGDLLYSFGREDAVTFYEGDGALFWTEEDPATGNTLIVRFPLDGDPAYFLEISESTPVNLSVDESHGKVLVTFRDSTPESPFYYLADVASGDVVELDIDPAFFSTLKNGNGQFIVLD